MTKAELIEAVLKGVKDELSKKAVGEVLDCAFGELKKAVKKDKRFSYPDFGTFTVKARKARTGRNPQTGETIKIKASKTVGFKPAPSFKESL
jgi:DNA-binding protein HU-beta